MHVQMCVALVGPALLPALHLVEPALLLPQMEPVWQEVSQLFSLCNLRETYCSHHQSWNQGSSSIKLSRSATFLAAPVLQTAVLSFGEALSTAHCCILPTWYSHTLVQLWRFVVEDSA